MLSPDVLLIINDRRLRSLTLAQLSEEGYEVSAVPRLRHGLALLQSGTRPRVIVLDLVKMEEPDRVVASLSAKAGVPILTAVGAVERERAERLGLTIVLNRPFTIGQLASRIHDLIGPPASAGSSH